MRGRSIAAARSAPPSGTRSVVLVGLMGCGKSAVGRRLAAKLGLPFVDADEEIEKAAGKTITDIFADHGEPYFREGERKVIARLLRVGPAGAGDRRRRLHECGDARHHPPSTASRSGSRRSCRCWCAACASATTARCSRQAIRSGACSSLMATRYPIYAEADITVESRDVPHEVIVGEIIESARPCRSDGDHRERARR